MRSINFFILIFSFLTLLISGFLFLNNFDINLIQNILKIVLIFGSIPLWFEILKDIYKGNFGVDLIAGLALLGTFLVGEYLSGVVILLMLSGGEVLEIYAMNRAKRELSALISKNPSLAHVKKGEKIEDVNIEEVEPNMLVVIKSGEIVSVDGVVVEGKTEIDESVLTGESVAILKQIGSQVYSGTTNTGSAIVVKVLKDPKETKYQEIIKLVENAQESKAPIMRLADRYAVYFTILTLTIAALAYFISSDWTRVVAVLVVATPCPLILATPIAIMSGMSKSSKRGIVVKDGSALENLASISTFIFDKTGTITLGEPQVSQVFTFSDLSQNEVLKISASLDQLSSHILARSLLKKINELNLNLAIPENFSEIFSDGVEGQLEKKK
jgi:cation transport ATPase